MRRRWIMVVAGLGVATLVLWSLTFKAEMVSPLPSQPLRDMTQRKQGRPVYVLLQPFSYCEDATGAVVVVREHFRTDFASIPQPARTLLREDGAYAQAAIIHDWLYAIGEPGKRADADRIMLAAMEEYGVPWATRNIIYQSVRAGGGKGYGLAGDWAFADPATLAAKPGGPKPASGIDRVLPGCAGYRDAVISGRLFRKTAG